MNVQRNRRNYTKEFKADAVGLVIEQGYSSAEVGRRLGFSEKNVNRWVRQYRDQHEIASTDGLYPGTTGKRSQALAQGKQAP